MKKATVSRMLGTIMIAVVLMAVTPAVSNYESVQEDVPEITVTPHDDREASRTGGN